MESTSTQTMPPSEAETVAESSPSVPALPAVSGRSAQFAKSLLVLTIGLVIWGLLALCVAALEPPSRKVSIDIWLFIGGFSLGAGFLMLSHRD